MDLGCTSIGVRVRVCVYVFFLENNEITAGNPHVTIRADGGSRLHINRFHISRDHYRGNCCFLCSCLDLYICTFICMKLWCIQTYINEIEIIIEGIAVSSAPAFSYMYVNVYIYMYEFVVYTDMSINMNIEMYIYMYIYMYEIVMYIDVWMKPWPRESLFLLLLLSRTYMYIHMYENFTYMSEYIWNH